MVPSNRDNRIAARAAKLETKEVANARNAKDSDCTLVLVWVRLTT